MGKEAKQLILIDNPNVKKLIRYNERVMEHLTLKGQGKKDETLLKAVREHLTVLKKIEKKK